MSKRKLFLLRGSSSSGKTTFINKYNLDPYTISSDDTRLFIKGPVLSLNPSGIAIDQSVTGEAWRQIQAQMERRMANGEFLILDSTSIHLRDIEKYQELCKQYRYDLVIVDFTKVSLEVLQQRNSERQPLYQVPDRVITKMHEDIQKYGDISNKYTVVNPDKFIKSLRNVVEDCCDYENIHVIGDTTGHLSALKKFVKLTNANQTTIDRTDLCIFVGLPRVEESNSELIEYLEILTSYEDIVFIEGFSKQPTSKKLILKPTSKKPQTEAAHPLYPYANTYKYLSAHGKRLLITHGGLHCLPSILQQISAEQLIFGVGDYDQASECATRFENQAGDDMYQVHSYRPFGDCDMPIEYSRTYNLFESDSTQQCIRVLTLSKEGFNFERYYDTCK